MKTSEIIDNMELQIPGFNQEEWDALPIDKTAFVDKLREELALAADGKSASEVRMALRSFVNAYIVKTTPDKEGRLRDLLVKDWLDLVVKTNVGLARGYRQYLQSTTSGAFMAFPAQELVKAEQTDEPLANWRARWEAAGGKIIGEGRMIALKTDPVWAAISAFGLPYPPFDWGSGMDVFSVKKSEAIRLGVVTADEVRAIAAKLS